MKKIIFLLGFLFIYTAQASGPMCAYLFEVTPVNLTEGPFVKRDHWDFHLVYLDVYERTGQPAEGLFNPIVLQKLIHQEKGSPASVHHLLNLSDMVGKLDQPNEIDPSVTNREYIKRDYLELRMRRSQVTEQSIEPYKVPKTDYNQRITDQRIFDILNRSGIPEQGIYDPVLVKLNLEQHIRESEAWPERAEAMKAATQVIETLLRDFSQSESDRKALVRDFEMLRTKLGL